MQRNAELTEVRFADRAVRLVFRLGKRGEKQRGKNRNDRNDDEKLYQRKATANEPIFPTLCLAKGHLPRREHGGFGSKNKREPMPNRVTSATLRHIARACAVRRSRFQYCASTSA